MKNLVLRFLERSLFFLSTVSLISAEQQRKKIFVAKNFR